MPCGQQFQLRTGTAQFIRQRGEPFGREASCVDVEDENGKLKKLLAEHDAHNAMLRDINSKKFGDACCEAGAVVHLAKHTV